MARLTYYGHAAFMVDTGKHRVLIDPFISGNPQAKVSADELSCDAILLTHGHGDHIGDTIPIARRCGALVVATYELAGYLDTQDVKNHPMHIGGYREFDFGAVKLIPAFHGGAVEGVEGVCCTPCGFLFTFDGKTLMHPGDTSLTIEFDLIGRMHEIDVALLPIGDNFTMGPEDALEAVRMLKPKLVVPMHFNTWELIAQDPEAFKKSVESGTTSKVAVVQPGESIEI
ncbi:MAG: metal-dependent hydrolase [Candidatus Glassbacteria bacterium]|nr:metal-dependent hydrolase [Candidatus Glassbacteria bacterium]